MRKYCSVHLSILVRFICVDPTVRKSNGCDTCSGTINQRFRCYFRTCTVSFESIELSHFSVISVRVWRLNFSFFYTCISQKGWPMIDMKYHRVIPFWHETIVYRRSSYNSCPPCYYYNCLLPPSGFPFRLENPFNLQARICNDWYRIERQSIH